MFVTIHTVMFIRISPEKWFLNISYTRYHQGVVLASSRFKRRSLRWKSGQDKVLRQCCPLRNSTKWNHPIRKMHDRQQCIFSVVTMDYNIPRDFLKSKTGGIHTIHHPSLDFLIPLAREKDLVVLPLEKKTSSRIPLRDLLKCCESAYQLIIVPGDHGHNDEKFEIRGKAKGINWVVRVSTWEVVQETKG